MQTDLPRTRTLVLCAALIVASYSAWAQIPTTSCPDEIVPLTIAVGEGIPLPKTFSNPTNRRVNFTVTMQDNIFFGPERTVLELSLEARTGRTMSVAPIYPTTLNTPVRSGMVVFNVTTDNADHGVIGQCRYQLDVEGPPPVFVRHPRFNVRTPRHLVQVPVRMCVLSGSLLSGERRNSDTIAGRAGTKIYELLLRANSEIWYPAAQIAFSTSIDTDYPVVDDPKQPELCSIEGNIADDGLASDGEPAQAAAACAQAWDRMYPGHVGLPVVWVRDVCLSGDVRGVSSGAPPRFKISGSRGEDLCASPRAVELQDMLDPSHPQYLAVIEPGREGGSDASVVPALAHEFGHNLFLGHGNGLDDDSDSVPLGSPGARLYDTYCDIDERSADSDRFSLMSAEISNNKELKPLQIETAREIGRVMPGARDTTPQGPLLDFD